MRRLSLVLGCALIAPMLAPLPAHAHVRSTGSRTEPVHVTAALPLSVTPASPRTVTLNNLGNATLSGTLANPNGFHRWGRPVQVTITNISNSQCKLNQISVQTSAPPAGGAAVVPNGSRTWSVAFSGSGQNCRNAVLTVSYPATQ
jgi:hypothetical protein